MMQIGERRIPLSQGKFALVDARDYDWLTQWKWCYGNGGYAIRAKYFATIYGGKKQKIIYMHRLIMDTPYGIQTDHINGEKVDNRRCNLRLCTIKENAMNLSPRKNTSSKYKGVSWQKKDGVWKAYIGINSTVKYLGLFRSEIEAAKAYNEAAIKIFGKFARLNPIIHMENLPVEVLHG